MRSAAIVKGEGEKKIETLRMQQQNAWRETNGEFFYSGHPFEGKPRIMHQSR